MDVETFQPYNCRSPVRDWLFGRPIRGDDEGDVFVVAALVVLGGLFGQRSFSIAHLEAAAGTDEFTRGFGHETPEPRRVSGSPCPTLLSKSLVANELVTHRVERVL